MKKRGHYCKICGEYKSNEKFSGKGHAAHICKTCASLPPEKKSEMAAMNRLLNLPWRLSKEQISWLKKRCTINAQTFGRSQRNNMKCGFCQPGSGRINQTKISQIFTMTYFE